MMNHSQNGSPALDMKRIEAAKANRQLQLENWRNYERQMQASEKHSKKNQPRKSNNLKVKFTDDCVLLDATLRGDYEEVSTSVCEQVRLKILRIYRGQDQVILISEDTNTNKFRNDLRSDIEYTREY
ncbi:unnamed protein product [Schistosoma margrebowiei]|uniref:Uncharacterized protein n=1 Tax=Schistosoma margrebowiei TaxID=48269 RepID=A0A183MJ10_9TREM|nr:unnamed protein product [Schistosoma margrebowiei]